MDGTGEKPPKPSRSIFNLIRSSFKSKLSTSSKYKGRDIKIAENVDLEKENAEENNFHTGNASKIAANSKLSSDGESHRKYFTLDSISDTNKTNEGPESGTLSVKPFVIENTELIAKEKQEEDIIEKMERKDGNLLVKETEEEMVNKENYPSRTESQLNHSTHSSTIEDGKEDQILVSDHLSEISDIVVGAMNCEESSIVNETKGLNYQPPSSPVSLTPQLSNFEDKQPTNDSLQNGTSSLSPEVKVDKENCGMVEVSQNKPGITKFLPKPYTKPSQQPLKKFSLTAKIVKKFRKGQLQETQTLTNDHPNTLLDSTATSSTKSTTTTIESQFPEVPPAVIEDKLSEEPHKLAEVPPKLAEEPHKLAEVPPKLSEVPPKLAEVPPKLAEEPHKLSEVPPKLSEEPHKLSEVPPKLSEVPPKLSEVPLKLTEDSLKLSEEPLKLSEEPLKLTEEPLKLSEVPHGSLDVNHMQNETASKSESIESHLIPDVKLPLESSSSIGTTIEDLPTPEGSSVSSFDIDSFIVLPESSASSSPQPLEPTCPITSEIMTPDSTAPVQHKDTSYTHCSSPVSAKSLMRQPDESIENDNCCMYGNFTIIYKDAHHIVQHLNDDMHKTMKQSIKRGNVKKLQELFSVGIHDKPNFPESPFPVNREKSGSSKPTRQGKDLRHVKKEGMKKEYNNNDDDVEAIKQKQSTIIESKFNNKNLIASHSYLKNPIQNGYNDTEVDAKNHLSDSFSDKGNTETECLLQQQNGTNSKISDDKNMNLMNNINCNEDKKVADTDAEKKNEKEFNVITETKVKAVESIPIKKHIIEIAETQILDPKHVLTVDKHSRKINAKSKETKPAIQEMSHATYLHVTQYMTNHHVKGLIKTWPPKKYTEEETYQDDSNSFQYTAESSRNEDENNNTNKTVLPDKIPPIEMAESNNHKTNTEQDISQTFAADSTNSHNVKIDLAGTKNAVSVAEKEEGGGGEEDRDIQETPSVVLPNIVSEEFDISIPQVDTSPPLETLPPITDIVTETVDTSLPLETLSPVTDIVTETVDTSLPLETVPPVTDIVTETVDTSLPLETVTPVTDIVTETVDTSLPLETLPVTDIVTETVDTSLPLETVTPVTDIVTETVDTNTVDTSPPLETLPPVTDIVTETTVYTSLTLETAPPVTDTVTETVDTSLPLETVSPVTDTVTETVDTSLTLETLPPVKDIVTETVDTNTVDTSLSLETLPPVTDIVTETVDTSLPLETLPPVTDIVTETVDTSPPLETLPPVTDNVTETVDTSLPLENVPPVTSDIVTETLDTSPPLETVTPVTDIVTETVDTGLPLETLPVTDIVAETVDSSLPLETLPPVTDIVTDTVDTSPPLETVPPVTSDIVTETVDTSPPPETVPPVTDTVTGTVDSNLPLETVPPVTDTVTETVDTSLPLETVPPVTDIVTETVDTSPPLETFPPVTDTVTYTVDTSPPLETVPPVTSDIVTETLDTSPPLETVTPVTDIVTRTVDTSLPLETVTPVTDIVTVTVDTSLPLEIVTPVTDIVTETVDTKTVDTSLPLETLPPVTDIITETVDTSLPLETLSPVTYTVTENVDTSLPLENVPPVTDIVTEAVDTSSPQETIPPVTDIVTETVDTSLPLEIVTPVADIVTETVDTSLPLETVPPVRDIVTQNTVDTSLPLETVSPVTDIVTDTVDTSPPLETVPPVTSDIVTETVDTSPPPETVPPVTDTVTGTVDSKTVYTSLPLETLPPVTDIVTETVDTSLPLETLSPVTYTVTENVDTSLPLENVPPVTDIVTETVDTSLPLETVPPVRDIVTENVNTIDTSPPLETVPPVTSDIVTETVDTSPPPETVPPVTDTVTGTVDSNLPLETVPPVTDTVTETVDTSLPLETVTPVTDIVTETVDTSPPLETHPPVTDIVTETVDTSLPLETLPPVTDTVTETVDTSLPLETVPPVTDIITETVDTSLPLENVPPVTSDIVTETVDTSPPLETVTPVTDIVTETVDTSLPLETVPPVTDIVTETVDTSLPLEIVTPVRDIVTQNVNTSIALETLPPVTDTVTESVDTSLPLETVTPVTDIVTRTVDTIDTSLPLEIVTPVTDIVTETVDTSLPLETLPPVTDIVTETVDTSLPLETVPPVTDTNVNTSIALETLPPVTDIVTETVDTSLPLETVSPVTDTVTYTVDTSPPLETVPPVTDTVTETVDTSPPLETVPPVTDIVTEIVDTSPPLETALPVTDTVTETVDAKTVDTSLSLETVPPVTDIVTDTVTETVDTSPPLENVPPVTDTVTETLNTSPPQETVTPVTDIITETVDTSPPLETFPPVTDIVTETVDTSLPLETVPPVTDIVTETVDTSLPLETVPVTDTVTETVDTSPPLETLPPVTDIVTETVDTILPLETLPPVTDIITETVDTSLPLETLPVTDIVTETVDTSPPQETVTPVTDIVTDISVDTSPPLETAPPVTDIVTETVDTSPPLETVTPVTDIVTETFDTSLPLETVPPVTSDIVTETVDRIDASLSLETVPPVTDIITETVYTSLPLETVPPVTDIVTETTVDTSLPLETLPPVTDIVTETVDTSLPLETIPPVTDIVTEIVDTSPPLETALPVTDTVTETVDTSLPLETVPPVTDTVTETVDTSLPLETVTPVTDTVTETVDTSLPLETVPPVTDTVTETVDTSLPLETVPPVTDIVTETVDTSLPLETLSPVTDTVTETVDTSLPLETVPPVTDIVTETTVDTSSPIETIPSIPSDTVISKTDINPAQESQEIPFPDIVTTNASVDMIAENTETSVFEYSAEGNIVNKESNQQRNAEIILNGNDEIVEKPSKNIEENIMFYGNFQTTSLMPDKFDSVMAYISDCSQYLGRENFEWLEPYITISQPKLAGPKQISTEDLSEIDVNSSVVVPHEAVQDEICQQKEVSVDSALAKCFENEGRDNKKDETVANPEISQITAADDDKKETLLSFTKQEVYKSKESDKNVITNIGVSEYNNVKHPRNMSCSSVNSYALVGTNETWATNEVTTHTNALTMHPTIVVTSMEKKLCQTECKNTDEIGVVVRENQNCFSEDCMRSTNTNETYTTPTAINENLETVTAINQANLKDNRGCEGESRGTERKLEQVEGSYTTAMLTRLSGSPQDIISSSTQQLEKDNESKERLATNATTAATSTTTASTAEIIRHESYRTAYPEVTNAIGTDNNTRANDNQSTGEVNGLAHHLNLAENITYIDDKRNEIDSHRRSSTCSSLGSNFLGEFASNQEKFASTTVNYNAETRELSKRKQVNLLRNVFESQQDVSGSPNKIKQTYTVKPFGHFFYDNLYHTHSPNSDGLVRHGSKDNENNEFVTGWVSDVQEKELLDSETSKTPETARLTGYHDVGSGRMDEKNLLTSPNVTNNIESVEKFQAAKRNLPETHVQSISADGNFIIRKPLGKNDTCLARIGHKNENIVLANENELSEAKTRIRTDEVVDYNIVETLKNPVTNQDETTNSQPNILAKTTQNTLSENPITPNHSDQVALANTETGLTTCENNNTPSLRNVENSHSFNTDDFISEPPDNTRRLPTHHAKEKTLVNDSDWIENGKAKASFKGRVNRRIKAFEISKRPKMELSNKPVKLKTRLSVFDSPTEGNTDYLYEKIKHELRPIPVEKFETKPDFIVKSPVCSLKSNDGSLESSEIINPDAISIQIEMGKVDRSDKNNSDCEYKVIRLTPSSEKQKPLKQVIYCDLNTEQNEQISEKARMEIGDGDGDEDEDDHDEKQETKKQKTSRIMHQFTPNNSLQYSEINSPDILEHTNSEHFIDSGTGTVSSDGETENPDNQVTYEEKLLPMENVVDQNPLSMSFDSPYKKIITIESVQEKYSTPIQLTNPKREESKTSPNDIYEYNTEPENISSDAEEDLKIVRGKLLIRNVIDLPKDGDEFVEDINVFADGFHLDKENPLYQSDPDISKKEDTEENSPKKQWNDDINFDSVDHIAKMHTNVLAVNNKQKLTKTLLSRLSNIDSKDIKQTINVEHKHEEIHGDIDFIHADGSRIESNFTDNFDSIAENVELWVQSSKAVILIKVIAERIIPIDYEFNVWRKSSAIVTRQIELDLQANEQRKRLYAHVMKKHLQSEHGYQIEGRDYGNYPEKERILTSQDTLKLFNQLLDVAEDSKEDGDQQERYTEKSEALVLQKPTTNDFMY
ncbi:hypothetical protein Ahia01_000734600 [Argonauta hians]